MIIKRWINYFFIGFSYLASKKIVVILILVLFGSLLKTSYGMKEELIIGDTNYEKASTDIKYYNKEDNKITVDERQNGALRYSLCMKSTLDVSEVNGNIKNKMDELNNLFNQSDEYFSFVYRDLYTGFTVSYNEEGEIFTASSIKAPMMIYLYEEASRGNINLDEMLTYTSKYNSSGSGVLKNKEKNTNYSVKQLIEYVIHDSDNNAYAMLMDRFKKENVLSYWQKLGTEKIYVYDSIWGSTSGHDVLIYMQELYDFYLNDDKYGIELMNLFKNAEWKMVTNKDGEFNTANKGGWANKVFHDMAIVFEENPYILAILSNTGESDYNNLFSKTSKLVGELHEEYWKYKESICKEIKQY